MKALNVLPFALFIVLVTAALHPELQAEDIRPLIYGEWKPLPANGFESNTRHIITAESWKIVTNEGTLTKEWKVTHCSDRQYGKHYGQINATFSSATEVPRFCVFYFSLDKKILYVNKGSQRDPDHILYALVKVK